jgi:hypothetical protein
LVLNVTVAFLLLLASAILGLLTGLFFRVWALVLVSPLIAVLAAIVLQVSAFRFAVGVPLIVGCLVVSQLAYLAMAFHLHKGELSIQDEADSDPDECGERNIRGKNN